MFNRSLAEMTNTPLCKTRSSREHFYVKKRCVWQEPTLFFRGTRREFSVPLQALVQMAILAVICVAVSVANRSPPRRRKRLHTAASCRRFLHADFDSP